MVDATDIALPSSHVKEVRPEEETKILEEEPKELVVSFSDFLQDSVMCTCHVLTMCTCHVSKCHVLTVY